MPRVPRAASATSPIGKASLHANAPKQRRLGSPGADQRQPSKHCPLLVGLTRPAGSVNRPSSAACPDSISASARFQVSPAVRSRLTSALSEILGPGRRPEDTPRDLDTGMKVRGEPGRNHRRREHRDALSDDRIDQAGKQGPRHMWAHSRKIAGDSRNDRVRRQGHRSVDTQFARWPRPGHRRDRRLHRRSAHSLSSRSAPGDARRSRSPIRPRSSVSSIQSSFGQRPRPQSTGAQVASSENGPVTSRSRFTEADS